MKISDKRPKSKQSHLALVLFMLLTLLFGMFLGRQHFLEMTFASAAAQVEQWLQTETAVNPILTLDIGFENYNQLLLQHDELIKNGVFIASDSDFVPASITFAEKVIPVKIRLQEGDATHRAGSEKWNFELQAEDGFVHGANSFYLIDPANNNGLNEWGYLQTLNQAGMQTTSYEFVNLVLNGNDLGIYALQEKPVYLGGALAEQLSGVVVSFNPVPIWQNVAYFNGNHDLARAEPVTNLDYFGWQYLEVLAAQNNFIATNEVLATQQEQALALLRSFQQGDLPASAVFDVEKYGLFLAISDLWGAADATSFEHLHYYFNPQTERLEPIGFNGNPSPENGRIHLQNATFNEPVLQQAYIRALQMISTSTYLSHLEAVLGDVWEQKQEHLPAGFASPDIWQTLAQQQLALQRSLHPQQPVLSYYEVVNDGAGSYLKIDVTNLVNLPVELVGVDINGNQFLELRPEWAAIEFSTQFMTLPPVQGTTRSYHIQIPLTAVQNHALASSELQLGTRILGTEFITFVPIRQYATKPVGQSE